MIWEGDLKTSYLTCLFEFFSEYNTLEFVRVEVKLVTNNRISASYRAGNNTVDISCFLFEFCDSSDSIQRDQKVIPFEQKFNGSLKNRNTND